jgi:Cu(I)/Ag(I) efflux system membrane fusion protein/cobalt-zinc-cadmium efflux system membrane fusion protein
MKSYRAAFLAALAGNVLLLAILAILATFALSSRHSRAAMPMPGAKSQASNAAMPPASPPAATEQAEAPLAPMQISAQRLQSIGVQTGEVQRRSVNDRVLTTGNVAMDETRLAYVQLRFSGYIQKVFVGATYQYVRKGQPLFTVYSPELVSTEREYLVARSSQRQLAQVSDPDITADTASVVNAAAERLRQWNIPKREIARLESSEQVQQDLAIDSPASGYVTEREALPNKYAQPDTRLYTVADLSTVWVFAQVFQNDLGRLEVGDSATLTVDTYPGRTFTGRVDFIYPDIDMATRTARVRLVFPNPALQLKPGMFVNVSLDIPMGEQLVIPAAGVLQSGTRQIVFVDHGGGSLEPREVQLGARAGGDFIVLKGLKSGEHIVTSANFLIDSESQLQAALGTFTPSPADASAAAAMSAPPVNVELSTEPNPPHKGSNLVRVRLTDDKGSPLTGAQVTTTFVMAGMPAMGMASMRVPVTLSDKGNGWYEASGKLENGGTWQVTMLAKKADQVLASKQLSVNVTGGM